MRHEKRFVAFSIYAVLTGLFFSACITGMPLSAQTETIFQPSALASPRSEDRKQSDTFMLVSEGKASYYSNQFHGRRTANGERFNMNDLTAAHRSLPFGTLVRVTNLRNGRDVIVRINDRGPFIKGRVIDLSAEAAKAIGLLQSGTAQVRVEAIDKNASVAYSG
ncbi:MAG: septal ring lytic transglycosylase RlpA family protein [Chlorobi bacterium]|nr:septal ring lytic transglycosylase RlpA family protein [Chlorobiota bacterium]